MKFLWCQLFKIVSLPFNPVSFNPHTLKLYIEFSPEDYVLNQLKSRVEELQKRGHHKYYKRYQGVLSFTLIYNNTRSGTQALPKGVIVSSTVYPHSVDFTGKLNFKSRPTQVRISKPKNIPVVLPSSPALQLVLYKIAQEILDLL